MWSIETSAPMNDLERQGEEGQIEEYTAQSRTSPAPAAARQDACLPTTQQAPSREYSSAGINNPYYFYKETHRMSTSQAAEYCVGQPPDLISSSTFNSVASTNSSRFSSTVTTPQNVLKKVATNSTGGNMCTEPVIEMLQYPVDLSNFRFFEEPGKSMLSEATHENDETSLRENDKLVLASGVNELPTHRNDEFITYEFHKFPVTEYDERRRNVIGAKPDAKRWGHTWGDWCCEAHVQPNEESMHPVSGHLFDQPCTYDYRQGPGGPGDQILLTQPKYPQDDGSPDIDYSSVDALHMSSSAKSFTSIEEIAELILPANSQPLNSDPCSSDTDESMDAFATTGPKMLLILSKHRLMVRLMQEVYVMFDKRWSIKSTSQAGSEASGSSSPDSKQGHLNVSQDSQRPGQKRRREREEGEGEDPGDDRIRKRRNGKERPDNSKNEKQTLACPYFQRDPARYSCNAVAGLKYRACMGPGFENVSRLKQHLKRVHKAPIQCTRCWKSMESLQAMTEHANSLTRCESRDPDPQGISQDKMDMINGTWGASWESIFEILFPGAPMLSPYYQRAMPSRLNATLPSPNSQNLSDFETYSRTELPRLIEANLQVLVDAEIGPLAENIKSLLVDVVKRCQSTVAQNYGRIVSSAVPDGTQIMQDPMSNIKQGGSDPPVTATDTNFVRSSFEEPPYRDLPASSQTSTASTNWLVTNGLYGRPPFPPLQSDSGYGTGDGAFFDDFDCHCGDRATTNDQIDGVCGACGLKRPFFWSYPAPL